jgi:hypothetical protein
VATGGTVATALHIDGATPDIVIVGKVLAADTREVDVLQNGRPIEQDHASRTPPTVALLTPRRGARLRGRVATLRWRSIDPDGDALEVTVRYSADDGRRWHTIYTGPDHGSVALPISLMSASKHARVRLYVSDGFDEGIATSPPFVVGGRPPVVSITIPYRGVRVAAGGALNLAGLAYHDTGTPLTAHRSRAYLARGPAGDRRRHACHGRLAGRWPLPDHPDRPRPARADLERHGASHDPPLAADPEAAARAAPHLFKGAITLDYGRHACSRRADDRERPRNRRP